MKLTKIIAVISLFDPAERWTSFLQKHWCSVVSSNRWEGEHNISSLHKNQAEENIIGGILYRHQRDYHTILFQEGVENAAADTHTLDTHKNSERCCLLMMSAGNASTPADQRNFQTRQGRPSETQHQAMRKTEGHCHGALNGTTDNTLAAGFMSQLPWHYPLAF